MCSLLWYAKSRGLQVVTVSQLPKIAYVLFEGAYHCQANMRAVFFHKKELLLWCKKNGFEWAPKQKLFLNKTVQRFATVTSVEPSRGVETGTILEKVDFTKEWRKLK